MTSVLYQIFSQVLWRLRHLPCPAFAVHSSLLPFLSQEMSLNIDINKILPVKVSGVCPKSLSRSLIFTIELQRCESWEDVPLEFCRLSIDSVKVSVALRSCDPILPVLPRFVGIWMLMDLSKTQYRIWKDLDLSALETYDFFITNQWHIFPWMIFPTKCLQSRDLILFGH